MTDVERRFETAMREIDTDEPGLVLEDDGTVWIVAPGGARTQIAGGGSQPVLQAITLPLSPARILTLADDPLELVPAPGVGKANWPLRWVFSSSAGTGYSFGYSIELTGWFAGVSFTKLVSVLGNPLLVGFLDSGNDTTADYSDRSDFENQPLGLSYSSNPADGDLTASITTLYHVVDLV